MRPFQEKLEALSQTGWAFEEPLIHQKMMAHIGAPDPYLRDTLVYEGLCELIAGPLMTTSQINDLMTLALNGLSYQISEQGNGVLKRSFCALIAAEIVEKDSAAPYISRDSWTKLHREMLLYAKMEHDFRGHDAELGWIHALAHFADLVEAVLKNPRPSPAQKAHHIHALLPMINQSAHAFCHDEDERVATAALTALRLEIATLPQLIVTLRCEPSAEHILTFNKKTFLKSLCIRLEEPHDQSLIVDALRQLTPHFYEKPN